MYTDEEMLMLSGIQHFMFCPRQWALIHINQEWEDNRLTLEGQLLHENVDNPFYRQKSGDVITLRSVHIASSKLGLYGLTDAVELTPAVDSTNAITHPKYPGYWNVLPVEYKHGKQKSNPCDEVQLAAQTICLEEMYGINIDYAALYYHEIRHRELIHIGEDLRNLTMSCAHQMHEIYVNRSIPPPIYKAHCKRCSLKDICLPELENSPKVSSYLKINLYEETP